ncbi:hypothetical protein PF008_g24395 [Phytophthora fragariae]|uniref:Uncharacterized protein n=1 Tax=Phytophthora fragariae TaxID=53985 RepID=A0A6G0QN11_9STRA|nr:hypothetical protein PF008_g24395 [Phytophthora fragariae]
MFGSKLKLKRNDGHSSDLAHSDSSFRILLRTSTMIDRRRLTSSADHRFPTGLKPMTQYKDPFQSWLRDRGIDLESLRRRNPQVERLFRSDFATLRAHQMQQKRSATQPSSDASDGEEEGEIREEEALGPLAQCARCASRTGEDKVEAEVAMYQSTRSARSRSELLATTVLPADEFRRIVERYGPNGYMNPIDPLPPIPILLRQDESLETYEKVFQKWLHYKELTLVMLKDDPEEERRYRQCYAYTRFRRKMWKESPKYRQRPRSRSRSPVRIHNNGQDWDRKRKYSTFKKSPTVKYEGDSYEKRPRQSWHRESDQSISLPVSGDSRHHDVKLETVRDRAGTLNKISRYHLQCRETPRYHDVKLETPARESKEMILDAKQQDVVDRFFEKLGQDVKHLCGGTGDTFLAIPPLLSTDGGESGISRGQEVGDSIPGKDSVVIQPSRVVSALQGDRVENWGGPAQPLVAADVSASLESTAEDSHTSSLVENANQRRNCVTIIEAASRTFAESEQLERDPLKLRLRDNYIRLSDQITVNEMAMEDLMAYVKTIETSDKDEASYNLIQIEEAAASVSEAKQLRDTALAVVVAHEWIGKESMLDKLLRPSIDENISDPEVHKKLALLYGKLQLKEERLEMLHEKLRLMRKEVSVAHDTQVEEILRLERTMSAMLSSRSQLEIQCHTLSIDLLRRKNFSPSGRQLTRKRDNSQALSA